jgi:predicted permease
MSAERYNRFWLRLKALFKRRQLDNDLRDELAFHLAKREEEHRARGMSADEARFAARRGFGGPTQLKEASREMWTFAAVEEFFSDLRYSARVLSKNPGFSATAIIAIALGIGLNVGIFSILNGVALRLLPIPAANQIVSVDQVFHGHYSRNVNGEPTLFSYSEYQAYRDQNHVFSGLIAYDPFLMATLGGGHSEQLFGVLASCNYFDVLNVHPALGRGFVAEDCAAPGSSAVVVISDSLWRGSFGADRALLGQTISLNHSPFRVIGIAAPGFGGAEPVPAAFWAPIPMQKAFDPQRNYLAENNTSWLAMLGRMRPGVTLDQVRADLSIIAGRFDLEHPGRSTTLAIRTATFLGRPEEHGLILTAGAVILGAFAMVLLIACANVASLLLARATARHKEIAIRLSVGATRGRLIRLLLAESLLLSMIGGVFGSLVAISSFDGILKFVISHLPAGAPPFAFNVQPDFRVFGYALLLTLLTGAAFGLLPALHASRADLNSALKENSPSEIGKPARAGFLRGLLVGAQVAVCMVLLLAAGLLLHGLYFAQTVEPGFERKDIFVADASLHRQGITPERALVLHQQLRERLAALPGVDSVALALHSPLNSDHTGGDFYLSGSDRQLMSEYSYVSPEFFPILGLPIVRGRNFTEPEARAGAQVVIVTESTARQFWPGQDPVGKAIRQSTDKDFRQVIGVARDAQVSHLGRSDEAFIYLLPSPKELPEVQFMIHRNASFAATQTDIRSVARSIDPDLPVSITRLEDNLEFWRAQSRLLVGLSAALGGLALILVAVGVYGMVSYSVSRRFREIGIRIALGAGGKNVLRLVFRRTLRPVAIGAGIGIIASVGVSLILRSLLYGISAFDPVAFLGVPAFLLAIAFLASYIPARRATRVDPVTALRYE